MQVKNQDYISQFNNISLISDILERNKSIVNLQMQVCVDHFFTKDEDTEYVLKIIENSEIYKQAITQ